MKIRVEHDVSALPGVVSIVDEIDLGNGHTDRAITLEAPLKRIVLETTIGDGVDVKKLVPDG